MPNNTTGCLTNICEDNLFKFQLKMFALGQQVFIIEQLQAQHFWSHFEAHVDRNAFGGNAVEVGL